MSAILSIIDYLPNLADHVFRAVITFLTTFVSHVVANVVNPSPFTAAVIMIEIAWIFFGAVYVINDKAVRS